MKINQIPYYLLPKLQDILFIGLLMVMAFNSPRLFQDGDLGRHITIGKYILESGHIPTQDIFSHTMYGQPLVPHEWLAQLLFAVVYLTTGFNGEVLLTALVIAVTFLLVYREILKRGAFRLVALTVALWAAMAAGIHWLARPHIFTFLFTALWTYNLESVTVSRHKRIWLFPLLMLVWANTHGAFIAGFVIWGVYFFEWLWEYRRGRSTKELGAKLGLIGAASFAITFVNPSGWHLWQTSVGYVGNNYLVGHTLEYLSPDFHDKSTWPYLLLLAYGWFALAADKRIRLREALLLAGWAAMSLYSARNIPLFAIITAPIFGGLIQHQAEKWPMLAKQDTGLRETEKRLRGFVWPAAAVLFLVFVFWQNIPLDAQGIGNRYDPKRFPVEAMNWLDKNPQEGNMFNEFIWGGYVLLREWPRELVFIDGQTDFYGEELTREYVQVGSLDDGWEDVLEKYKVNWALIPSDAPLTKTLIGQGWRELYRDSTAVILRK